MAMIVTFWERIREVIHFQSSSSVFFSFVFLLFFFCFSFVFLLIISFQRARLFQLVAETQYDAN